MAEDAIVLSANRRPDGSFPRPARISAGARMSVLRVLTVDDELLALKRLKLLLQAIPYVEHVGEASSCAEALSEIAALGPDVILLDIKMRDGDGFEVIEALAERPNPPLIIFVTAFDHYAVRAFDSAVVDLSA
jgi:two-component system LytT family response regulator